MQLSQLLEWYNLIFVAPIGLAGVYLILSASGLGGHTDHDIDTHADFDAGHDVDFGHDVDVAHDIDVDQDVDLGHDIDVDQDVDLGHDIDVDHDVDLGHDIDVGHDVDLGHAADAGHGLGGGHVADLVHGVEVGHDLAAGHADVGHGAAGSHELADGSHHEAPLVVRALSVLGFGKVPLSILMTCLMVIFGAAGLISNGLFESVLPWKWAPTLYFWPSLCFATVVAFGLTGSIARGLNRIMPTSETYAQRPEDLVGRMGTTVYGLRSGQKGVVTVKDEGGTWQRVAAVPTVDEIARDTEVILVRYHREGDYYDVGPSPL